MREGVDKSGSWLGGGEGQERSGSERGRVGICVCYFLRHFLSETSPVKKELMAPSLKILC